MRGVAMWLMLAAACGTPGGALPDGAPFTDPIRADADSGGDADTDADADSDTDTDADSDTHLNTDTGASVPSDVPPTDGPTDTGFDVDSSATLYAILTEGSATVSPGTSWVGQEYTGFYVLNLSTFLRWRDHVRPVAETNVSDGCEVRWEVQDVASAGQALIARDEQRLQNCPSCDFAFAVVASNQQDVTNDGWDTGVTVDTGASAAGCGFLSRVLGFDFNAPADPTLYGFVQAYAGGDDAVLAFEAGGWTLRGSGRFDAASGALDYRVTWSAGLLQY